MCIGSRSDAQEIPLCITARPLCLNDLREPFASINADLTLWNSFPNVCRRNKAIRWWIEPGLIPESTHSGRAAVELRGRRNFHRIHQLCPSNFAKRSSFLLNHYSGRLDDRCDFVACFELEFVRA